MTYRDGDYSDAWIAAGMRAQADALDHANGILHRRLGTMADDKVTESRPVEPMVVTLVGTGDGTRLPSGTSAETPGAHTPNLVVQVVGPVLAISIRFANTFMTSLLGILTGAMATDVIPAADFWQLLFKCAGLSVAGAIVGLIKDFVTVFGRLEQKNPLLTGSV